MLKNVRLFLCPYIERPCLYLWPGSPLICVLQFLLKSMRETRCGWACSTTSSASAPTRPPASRSLPGRTGSPPRQPTAGTSRYYCTMSNLVPYTYDKRFFPQDLNANARQLCLRVRNNAGDIHDKGCEQQYAFLCQYDCDDVYTGLVKKNKKLLMYF